jgi:hypothetical protein
VSVNYARLRGARGIRGGRGSDYLDGPGLACLVSAPLGRAHDVTFQVGTGRTAHWGCPWSRQLSTRAKEAQCRVLVYAAFAIGHVGGFLDCAHIRLLLKEIRDSARIGPARVQCPFQGRALYEASCGVSPVLPRAPDPAASLGVRRWHGPGPLAFPPGEGPCAARGRSIFALSACPGQPGQAARRWPFKPKPTYAPHYTTTVL